MPQTKKCKRCKRTKPISEFFIWNRSKDGFDAHCKKCKRWFNLQSYYKNREKRIIKNKEWASKNKDKIREYTKKNHELHRGRNKLSAQKRKIATYGITLEQYKELLKKQNGVCAICKKRPKIRRLAIDHNHKCCPPNKSCGKCIRGLLCGNCNRMLGYSKESIENLHNAILYLQK